MTIVRALNAERLKTRRTLAFRLAIVIPAAIAGLQFFVFYRSGVRPMFEDQAPWTLFTQQTLVIWSLLMLPLFVTLETALVSGLEHNNHQWKHLFALPIPRKAVYAAKQIAGMALIGLSMLCLAAFTVLAGLLLRVLKPGWGFEAPPPWGTFLLHCAIVYLSSWLLISLHTWVGLRWQSFVVASAVGITMTVAGVIVINAEWGGFYPWALPGVIANGFSKGLEHPAELTFGCLGGIVAALAGGWAFTAIIILETTTTDAIVRTFFNILYSSVN